MSILDETPIASRAFNTLTTQFMGAVSGTLPGVEREKGLLVTHDDIRNIKRYIMRGLALPTNAAEIEQIYKYDQLNVNGLRSADMQVLYTSIKDHSETWSKIEAGMKTVGSDLHVFADNLIFISNEIIQYLNTIPSFISGAGKIGHLSPEEIENLPEIQLTPEELPRSYNLPGLTDQLKELIEERSKSTHTVKAQITRFKDAINHSIKPALDLKLALINSQDFGEDTIRQNERLLVLSERIKGRQAEIESYSKKKWWGLVGGLPGLVVTATVFGKKAQRARRYQQELIDERRTIEETLRTNHKLLAHLNSLETDMHELKARVESAAGSSSNLESLWELIQTYIDTSCSRVNGVTNAMYLVSFAARLSTMAYNWTRIKEQAHDLLTAFNNATNETLFLGAFKPTPLQTLSLSSALLPPTFENYAMSRTHSIETETGYTLPDIKEIQAYRAQLNHKISMLSNLYIPALAEEFTALRKALNNTDDQAKRAATQIPVALQANQIVRLHGVIEKLRENPTPEEQEAIESFSQEIKQLIDDALSETDKHVVALDKSLTSLNAVTLSDNEHRTRELDDTINKTELRAGTEQTTIRRLVVQETKLNESIKLLESTNGFSLIKHLLLTAGTLGLMSLSPPQLKLIRQGVDVAGKLLGLVVGSIKYDNLIEARHQLQIQLDRHRETSALTQKELGVLRNRHQLLVEAQSVPPLREAYSNEISQLSGSIGHFLNLNNHGTSAELETVILTFLRESAVLADHLNSFRQEWRH